jgi:hypothetical protein
VRALPSISRFILSEELIEEVAQDLKDRSEALKQLKAHLLLSQGQMKKFVNRLRTPFTHTHTHTPAWSFHLLKPTNNPGPLQDAS